MRTKSAQASAVLANPSHSARAIVTVWNNDGDASFELTDEALGIDPVLEVEINQDVDSFRTARVTLQRQQGLRSLAPLVQTGNPLYDGAEPLVFIHRRIVIEAELQLPDISETPAGLRETIFDGWIDELEWPTDEMVLVCTDKSAEPRDTWIEWERIYGLAQGVNATKGLRIWSNSDYGYLPPLAVGDLVLPSEENQNGHFYKVTAAASAQSTAEPVWPTGSGATVVSGGVTLTEAGSTHPSTGVSAVTLIDQILADNGLGITLESVPVDPGWNVKPYVQQRQSVMDAIHAIVEQLGWYVRFEWNSGAGEYVLTLAEPDRTSTTVHKVLDEVEEDECDELGLAVWDIRNVVRVIYGDSSSLDPGGGPTRIIREVKDQPSIDKYGRRFMEVAEADGSNIDTSTEADRLANAILADLKDPLIGTGYSFPVDPYLELGDRITLPADTLRFTSSQTLAVQSLRHTFREEGAKTRVTLRGAPAARQAGWLVKDGRVNASDVHHVNQLSNTAPNTTVTPIVGGMRITREGSKTKSALPRYYEVHVSTVQGFTPSSSTRVASAEADTADIASLVPGKQYFKRTIPYSRNSSRVVRGEPSVESSFTAGRAKAGHYDSTSTQSHLPLNGNFEHASDDLSTAPPDHWAVVTRPTESTEVWGSSGSVYYGTAGTTKGRYIELRAHASKRGNLVSSPFEVRRGLRNFNLYASIRRQGSSAVSGKDLIVDVIGYSDAALTNQIVSGSIFLSGSASGPYPSLNTWYDAAVDIASSLGALGSAVNFITIGLRRGTTGDSSFSWEIGDVYFQEADFYTARIDNLAVGRGTNVTHVRAKTATAGSYASGATLVFGTEDLDSLGEYNTATGIFTATVAGIYNVSAQIWIDTLSYNSGNAAFLELQKNGSTFVAYGSRPFAPSTASWYLTSNLATTIELAAGDNLRLVVSHTRAAGNIQLFPDNNANFLSIDRLV